MWNVNRHDLTMAEGDYGLALPVRVTGATFAGGDSIRFTFSATLNGTPILIKEFTNIEDNTVLLEFTQEESELFRVGVFYYALDWYKDGVFMCNIIPQALFKVVDKVWM